MGRSALQSEQNSSFHPQFSDWLGFNTINLLNDPPSSNEFEYSANRYEEQPSWHRSEN